MFNWTISLSDKQVVMLMAFFNGEDDKNGSRFESVNAMIGDAWDVRAVRKLQEDNLLSIREMLQENGYRQNIWNITEKGQLIALAIMEDAENLRVISDRAGRSGMHIANTTHPRIKAKAKGKK